MRLAVGMEEGQAVQALVVLGEASEAEEQGVGAHLHQHPPLLPALRGQDPGDFHHQHLGGGLRPLLALADGGLGGAQGPGGRLGGRDGDGAGVRWGLGEGGVRRGP